MKSQSYFHSNLPVRKVLQRLDQQIARLEAQRDVVCAALRNEFALADPAAQLRTGPLHPAPSPASRTDSLHLPGTPLRGSVHRTRNRLPRSRKC